MAHVPLAPIGSPLDEQLDPATRDAQAAAMAAWTGDPLAMTGLVATRVSK